MTIGVGYDVETNPKEVSANVRLQLKEQAHQVDVQLVIDRVLPFAVQVTLKSEGTAADIAAQIAQPLAQSLGYALPPVAAGLVAGRVVDLFSMPMQPMNVLGTPIQANLGRPEVTGWDGMLMVKADLQVE